MRKRVDAMSTATLLQKEEYQFAKEMEAYVESMKQRKDEAGNSLYDEAKKALVRTGVITPKGNTKKKIVSWE